MGKRVVIILVLFWASASFAQNFPFYFHADYPEFTPVSKSFEVSITARFQKTDADEIDLFVLVDDQVYPEDVVFKTGSLKKRLKYKEAKFGDDNGKAYRIRINPDSTFVYDSPFQLNLQLTGYDLEETEIGFGIEYRKNKKLIRQFSSYDNDDDNILPVVKINFYKSQAVAGKRMVISGDSDFNFSLKENTKPENLLLEFWAQFDSEDFNFLTLSNTYRRDTLLTLITNRFKFLSTSLMNGKLSINEAYLGKSSWNHIAVFLSTKQKNIKVYCNEKEIFSVPLDYSYTLKNIRFDFGVSTEKGSYSIDLLRVWEYNNSPELAFQNMHYLSYNADSSKVLFNLNFDDPGVVAALTQNKNIAVEETDLDYRQSDAPVFSRVPELNLYVYNGFYSIEWQNKDVVQPKEFSLEKSVNGDDYAEVYSVTPDNGNDPSKVYYFSDQKNPDDEVVLYRLKQTNKDGTISYSSQIKIGQGQKKLFTTGQNFPNPFNPTTTISVDVIEESEFTISVYDLVGKKVATLQEGRLGQGRHTFEFDGSNLPSGIYFYEVKSPTSTIVKKMILAK